MDRELIGAGATLLVAGAVLTATHVGTGDDLLVRWGLLTSIWTLLYGRKLFMLGGS